MALKKDYKYLYEMVSQDLLGQIAKTQELEEELTRIRTSDNISLRERIALAGFVNWPSADEAYSWITGNSKSPKTIGLIVDAPGWETAAARTRRENKKVNDLAVKPSNKFATGKKTSKKSGYTPKGMLRAIGVTGKAAKDILAGKNPKTGKRSYTKKSKFWAKKKK